MKLTPEQKLLASRIKFIKSIFDRHRTSHNFGAELRWKDVLLSIHSEDELYFYSKEQLESRITYHEIKNLESLYLFNIQNENKTYQDTVAQEHEYEGYKYSPSVQSSTILPSNEQIETTEIPSKDDSDRFNHTDRETHKSKDNSEVKDSIDWDTFFTSPTQTASLRGSHQRDTARSIYTKFIYDNLRACLLEGGAGNGKTFVAGAVIRKLLDHPTFLKDCISPWPILWITRASIVEQTSRVCRELFGLCPHTECIVINVEQLRAKFGGYMVEEKTVVMGGEEHILWKWKERFHPKVFIIDECQLAKNEDSTQSKIIQALSELEGIYLLFMSATPWTRVSESRYFAINTHLEIKI